MNHAIIEWYPSEMGIDGREIKCVHGPFPSRVLAMDYVALHCLVYNNCEFITLKKVMESNHERTSLVV